MERQPRVLLVRGAPAADTVASALADADFDVEMVEGLAGALEVLSGAPFDCVVSVGAAGDDTDVVELVRRVREMQSDLPVVLFADRDEEAAASGIVAAGVADLVRRTDDDDHSRLLGRVRNAVARRQAVRRAEQQANLNAVIRELNQALVRADGRDEIEDAVCERLARSEQYNFAWLAAVDDDGLRLRAMGVEGDAVEGRGAVSVDRGTAFTEPVRAAADRREVIVERDVAGRGGAWEAALGQSFSAVAAVPAVYEDVLYGVLVLYTDRAGAFNEEERRVLGELGENIAYAMNAVAVRRRTALRERELRRQNERLERFASVVSHDLRNPLNVAKGYVEVLGEQLDGEPAAHIARVDEALKRMDELISEVLELARQGETIEEPAAVDLAAVATEAWATVETGRADLVTESAELLADDSRLARLLENLFRNAVEHAFDGAASGGTDNGEESASGGAVRVGPIQEGGDVVGFFVEDDGPGIPADEREDVMEMGYTNSQDGTGFGLAIVAEIAGAHGWEPAVTDASGAETPGGGTFDGARFEFTGVEVPGEEPVERVED